MKSLTSKSFSKVAIAVFVAPMVTLVCTPYAQAFVSTTANMNANTHVMTHLNVAGVLTSCDPNSDCDPNLNPLNESPAPSPQPTPVLIPPRDYSAAITSLLKSSGLIDKIVDSVWNDVGKEITVQEIKNQINGRRFSDGVSGYNANVNLGVITDNNVTLGPKPNQISVKIVISGNDVEFKTTTPCVKTIFGCIGLGSYADPSFRLGFDLTANLIISVNQFPNPIKVDELIVQTSNTSIRGSNAVGTIVETLGDFFTGGDFSRSITSRANQQVDLKDKLGGNIKLAIDRF